METTFTYSPYGPLMQRLAPAKPPIPARLAYAADYPSHRDLALRLKEGRAAAVREAAAMLLTLLPPGPLTLIPAPSHIGRATYMLRVAQAVARMRQGRTVVFDTLRTEAHPSRYALKHGGTDPEDIPATEMRLLSARKASLLETLRHETTTVVIDDIVDTGDTIREALRATKGSFAACLALTGRLATGA